MRFVKLQTEITLCLRYRLALAGRHSATVGQPFLRRQLTLRRTVSPAQWTAHLMAMVKYRLCIRTRLSHSLPLVEISLYCRVQYPLSPWPFSHGHEQNPPTTRGTVPFSQPYDEHILSGAGGVLGGNLPNGNKISFQASSVGSGITTDRKSLSRASSSSVSMNSNNQVYDCPPSCFYVFQHGRTASMPGFHKGNSTRTWGTSHKSSTG